MRAQSSISPLALGVCCAVVAGALALAPSRGTSPMGAWRGADVVALEGEAMNRDQQPTPSIGPDQAGATAAADVVVPTTSGTASPQGEGVDTSCTEDCGGAQEPTAVPIGTASDEVASEGTDGDGPPGTDAPGSDVPVPETGVTAADGSTDSTEDRADLDSCRSPRAVAARNGGDTDVAPPSPCSQGRGHDPCEAPNCSGGRSRGTTEV